MVTVRLMFRMGTEPILSVKRSVSIDTMINFDGDRDGYLDGDGTCKQALNTIICWHGLHCGKRKRKRRRYV